MYMVDIDVEYGFARNIIANVIFINFNSTSFKNVEIYADWIHKYTFIRDLRIVFNDRSYTIFEKANCLYLADIDDTLKKDDFISTGRHTITLVGGKEILKIKLGC